MNIAKSDPWETAEDWPTRVCEPVIQYPMAPREARTILDVAGQMLADGVSVYTLLNTMITSKDNDNNNQR